MGSLLRCLNGGIWFPHQPSTSSLPQSLLVCCAAVGPPQLLGGPHPQAVPSAVFFHFADILSRLSSICFLLLYGN